MAKKRKVQDTTIHVGATSEQAKRWRAAAESEKRSLSQWAAIALDKATEERNEK